MNKNLANLPASCHGVLPSDHSIIVIKAGEAGYWQTGYRPATRKEADEFANHLNQRQGVTYYQRLAMENGSMFGWECEAASPEFWKDHLQKHPDIADENGLLK